MTRAIQWCGRVLGGARGRLRRARPGSVLIMVIALLVMLALIGTAAMSVARVDRVSSKNNVANTQVDMLAESVKQLVIARLVEDLFSTQGFNTTDSATNDPDFPRVTRDAILGARLAERQLTYNGADPMASVHPADTYAWPTLSYPPIQNGGDLMPYKFDNPMEDSTNLVQYGLPTPKVAFAPTTVSLADGTVMPALQAFNLNGTAMTKFSDGSTARIGSAFLAADADGDGIADAVLFKLPISPLGGITYYGAVRVVDNAAAININTAWNPDQEYVDVKAKDAGYVFPNDPSRSSVRMSFAGVYPGSVNLAGLITTGEMGNLYNVWSTGDQTKAGPSPVNLTPVGRDDFRFLTPGDAYHNQIVRRLDNPGYVTGGQLGGGGIRPFGISDAMTLAYRNVLTTNTSGTPDTAAERALQVATFNNAQRGPYPAGSVPQWFFANYDYAWSGINAGKAPGANANPLLRSLFTSMNPVRNLVERNTLTANYAFGRMGAGVPFAYPSKANINTATFDELWRGFFDVMCDTGTTSPFDHGMNAGLYVGERFAPDTFLSIDEENQGRMFRSPLRPGKANDDTARLHPYQVMVLRAAIAAANVVTMRGDSDQIVPAIDIVLPNPLPNGQTAMGGVNFFPGSIKADGSVDAAGGVKATVFGVGRQPFIVEALMNNNVEKQAPAGPPAGGGEKGQPVALLDDPAPPPSAAKQNKAGLAVVQIYNPYDTELNISGWKLGLISRTKQADGVTPITNWSQANLQMRDLPVSTATPGTLSQDPGADGPGYVFNGDDARIPPHGFLVITNRPAAGVAAGGDSPDAAEYAPQTVEDVATRTGDATTPGVRRIYLKTLHHMMDRELVLLRKARAPGDPADTFRWAPVDSFDASGIEHKVYIEGGPAAPGALATGWHYRRATDPQQNRNWHCVFPGRYDGSLTARRHQGTEQETWDPTMAEEPWVKTPNADQFKFGKYAGRSSRETGDGAAGTSTNSYPIQVANLDAGYHFLDGNDKPTFPLHGFLRVGDLLHVTDVGSYTIWTGASAPIAGPFVEVNSLPMDAAFADDTDSKTDRFNPATGESWESVGRMVPLYDPNVGGGERFDLNAKRYSGSGQLTSASTIVDYSLSQLDDFWTGYEVVIYNSDKSAAAKWVSQRRVVGAFKNKGATGGEVTADVAFDTGNGTTGPQVGKTYEYKLRKIRYGWADKLFDYFTTINAPADDYLPNKDPFAGSFGPEPVKNLADPARKINRNAAANELSEDDVGIEGLININTANWKVLAALPMVVDPTTGKVKPDDNEDLARRIAYFRDVDDGMRPDPSRPNDPHPHGPFRSVMELLLVPRFADAAGTLFNGNGYTYGDFSPLTQNATGDGVRGDFEEKYLALTRISNLVTLHSDCFTAYIMVQGWRDAGTPNAKLVVQRRLAFIVDRSTCSPAKRAPKVYNVPSAF